MRPLRLMLKTCFTCLFSAIKLILPDIVRRFSEPPYSGFFGLHGLRSPLSKPFKLAFLQIVLLYFTAACQPVQQNESKQRYEFSEAKMGTLFRIVLYAEDSLTATRAATAAFARIDTLNQILSDYDRNSELSQLSAASGSGKKIKVSDDLWKVLTHAHQIAEATEGAFDITVGPLVKLWRRARRRGVLPENDRLQQAKTSVGYQHILLDSTHQSVQLTQPDMLLDLGGIAKGYALDEAMKVLQKHSITSALVDGGGDILVSNPPPDKKGWTIALEGTEQNENTEKANLTLSNQAIASSGDLYQFLEIDGKRYSHIIDPKTGVGLTSQVRVTILAPSGMLADAYASAVSVLGVKKGVDFIESKPGVDGVVMQEKDGEVNVWQTTHIPNH